MKYYKRMNRYTLFWITFVFVPILCAAAYNLVYTWPGRQIFWIDIECIIVSVIMIVLHVIIILRTQSEYIINIDSNEMIGAITSERKSSRRKEYIEDPKATELANDINASGFD